MPLHRRQHLRAAWLTLLLFILAALAPTVSRAMAHVQGQLAPWATLCSAADIASRGGPADALKHHTDHCPACQLQASDMAPPPAATDGLPRCPTATRLARVGAPVRAAAAPWSHGQPRAPPSDL